MSTEIPGTALQLQSLVKADQTVDLFLETVTVPEPGPSEVVVRVEAAPINPSDLGLLLAGADASTAVTGGPADRPVVTLPLPDAAMRVMKARVGVPMPRRQRGGRSRRRGRLVRRRPGPARQDGSSRWRRHVLPVPLRGHVAVPGVA